MHGLQKRISFSAEAQHELSPIKDTCQGWIESIGALAKGFSLKFASFEQGKIHNPMSGGSGEASLLPEMNQNTPVKDRPSNLLESIDRSLAVLRRFYFTEMVTIFILFLMLGVFITTFAATSNRYKQPLTFQGRITGSDNIPVADGSYNIKFAIYSDAGGVACVWATGSCGTRAAVPVSVSRGLFTAPLGDTSFHANMPTLSLNFENGRYFVGVTVGSDSEMTPRTQIGGTSYAYNTDLFEGYATSTFAVLNGKIGGQTLVGGTAPTDDLTVKTTSGTAEVGANMVFQTGDNGTTEAMRIAYDGKIGIGVVAPTTKLDILGNVRLVDNEARDNVFISGGNTTVTGTGNIGIGDTAVLSLTTGSGNIAVGSRALEQTTSGANNIAIGPQALIWNTTGSTNLAIGYQALVNNLTGASNVGVGFGSLLQSTTGSNNAVFGISALEANTTGSTNVALGNQAGRQNVGSGNVFLGYRAGYNLTNSSNTFIVGNSENSSLIYGNFSTGRVGIGTSTPSAVLQVSGGASTSVPAAILDHTTTYVSGATSGLVLSAQRAITVNDGGAGLSTTITDPLATFQDNCTVTSGSCVSNVDGVRISQLYSGNTASALNVTTAGSGFVFRANDDGTLTDATPFVIGSTGNVGIGTTTPSSSLDIQGALRLSGATSGYIAFQAPATSTPATYSLPVTDGTNGQVLSTNGSGMLSWATGGGASQWTTGGSNIYFSTGNVGIGVSSNITARLTLSGGIMIDGSAQRGAWNSRVPKANVSTTIDSGGDVGRDASITVGADGLPVIAYRDASNLDLKVIKCGNAACSSGNTTTSVDTAGDVGYETSIAIGTDGFPVISYFDNTNADLKVYTCSTASCNAGSAASVDTVGSVGLASSITIGTDGFPVVSYRDNSNEDLKVTKCGNAACSAGNTTTSVDTVGSVANYTSIAIGTDGFPIIAFLDLTNYNLRVSKCANAACSGAPTTTSIDTVGDVGAYPSITIGEDGFAVIAYFDTTNTDLKVYKCNNATCAAGTTTSVDTVGDMGRHASITIGADGLPVIGHVDWSNFDARITKCGNAACSAGNTSTSIDTVGILGSFTTLAIGADGLPVLAYLDNGNSDLKVTKCGSDMCISNWTRR